MSSDIGHGRAGEHAGGGGARPGWSKRAAAMHDRLALPVMSDKHDHRVKLEADLKALHDEMTAARREDEPATDDAKSRTGIRKHRSDKEG